MLTFGLDLFSLSACKGLSGRDKVVDTVGVRPVGWVRLLSFPLERGSLYGMLKLEDRVSQNCVTGLCSFKFFLQVAILRDCVK